MAQLNHLGPPARHKGHLGNEVGVNDHKQVVRVYAHVLMTNGVTTEEDGTSSELVLAQVSHRRAC